MAESRDWPLQAFRTFERESYYQGGNWHQWTGWENETDGCRELSYGVRSFHVSYQLEESRIDECIAAGQHGTLESGSGVSNVWSAATLAVVVAMHALAC